MAVAFRIFVFKDISLSKDISTINRRVFLHREQDPALLKVHFVFVGPTGLCFTAFYLPQARLCLYSPFLSISLSVSLTFLCHPPILAFFDGCGGCVA